MLSHKLQENGIRAVRADGNADLLIVQTAVECASRHPITLIGEDTDRLVLLCMHADTTSFPLLFRSEGHQTSKKMRRIWNINWLKKQLGPKICSLLPFVHAITGCDTTSRLFGVGKEAALKKLRSNVELKKEAAGFLKQSSKEEVTCLNGGDYGEGLAVLRYRKFCEKAMRGCSFVQVHTLPPTTAAAQSHSARTYFQC
ncbi:hypothetical protein Hamer_G000597 [Homarus americanus]|uniref:Uncharacterized protein n=1 Tax=Homarus americanus TaxID=6706 RepID=A0A8J5TKB5_HOMAM|nr:hypothetical protein Hamer_G000597 [Homarus americanus]